MPKHACKALQLYPVELGTAEGPHVWEVHAPSKWVLKKGNVCHFCAGRLGGAGLPRACFLCSRVPGKTNKGTVPA